MNYKFKEKNFHFGWEWMGKKGKGWMLILYALNIFGTIGYWCLNLKCVNFFLVRKHWYTKRRQKGWLVGAWNGDHCWNLSIISEISFISCMIYQYRISDSSETNFWNTINCIFAFSCQLQKYLGFIYICQWLGGSLTPSQCFHLEVSGMTDCWIKDCISDFTFLLLLFFQLQVFHFYLSEK